MMNNTCDREHSQLRESPVWGGLVESQAGPWRHKCAACAYELGVEEGLRRGAQLAAELAGRLETEADRSRIG